MASTRIALTLALATLALPAGAAVLYKSVSPTGVVEFSDTPPTGAAKIVEQRELGSSVGAPTSGPLLAGQGSRSLAMDALAHDEEVVNAANQVDLAEHALALARREVWAPMEGLKLRRIVRTPSDEERIDHFKRGVVLARQNLLDVMKRRAAVLATPGTPFVTASISR